ncbi:MAG: hypothetical protein ACYCS7_13685 [Acidimicrobiales bacterium]
MTATLTVGSRRRWGSFGAWLLIGAGYALGLIGIFSIGLFVLPVAVVTTVLLARRTSSVPGLPGLIAGLGLPPFYIAYLNRAGPGNVCVTIPGGQSCSQELSPWPWVAAGLLFVIFGVVGFLLGSRNP